MVLLFLMGWTTSQTGPARPDVPNFRTHSANEGRFGRNPRAEGRGNRLYMLANRAMPPYSRAVNRRRDMHSTAPGR